jgi:2-methylisocitrate lyase-like PEP mutase family enzyme
MSEEAQPMPDALPPVLGGAPEPGARRRRLRDLLGARTATLVPGVVDALTAVVAEDAGFECCYLTGAGMANMALGAPDVGLVSLDALVTQARRMVAATSIAVIVDVDTGFGGPTSLMHVIQVLESAGVSAVQIEDQTIPKRCGHFDRKSVVTVAEMQRKIDAATRARRDDALVVIARTDAIAVEGFDAAIDRARHYAEAGADVLFVEAPTDLEQLRAIPRLLPQLPHLANVVEGGRTPVLPAAQLADLGYRLVLHANVTMRAMVWAAQQTLSYLRRNGRSDHPSVPFIGWQERQALVRLGDFDDIEDELARRWPEAR